MAKIERKLEQLRTLSPAALKEEWSAWRTEPVPRLSPDLMRLAIDYAMQEKSSGKLPRLIEKQLDREPKQLLRPRTAIYPGSQLVRSWNDRTISVDVTESGFLFDGREYKSLSSIAREVTGVQWSGPRFFGLVGNGR